MARRGVVGAVKGFGYRISPINSRGYTHGTSILNKSTANPGAKSSRKKNTIAIPWFGVKLVGKFTHSLLYRGQLTVKTGV